ncbi:alpha/beta hydrolase [Arachidicoccus soli]|uniref:Esterase family protein n=1 Tax=Arachidicoccus soli TaxID=2341117 RepID=A0A386HUF2_9BACT|nr:alpha/beta hydrolase family protein [Arachidicoccus soli]AYD49339.1 esterase family protein [Arachidicoccus soli]
MKKPKAIIWLLLLFFTLTSVSKAATVDTISVYSQAMSRNVKSVIVLPQGYSNDTKYPVVYLLHGFSGNYSDWITKVPAIKDYADQYHFIIVCPDGGFAGWYFDSPIEKNNQYETYITKELLHWVDKHYSTINNRKGRAILGLSMGGHGALFLAFKHQDLYGATGSMSGAVDITGLANSFGIAELLGPYSKFPQRWKEHSVIGLTNLLVNDSLKIIIDCGASDFLYQENLALHKKLLYDKIDHDFLTRPGSHTWEYWAGSVQYELLFIHNYFISKNDSTFSN